MTATPPGYKIKPGETQSTELQPGQDMTPAPPQTQIVIQHAGSGLPQRPDLQSHEQGYYANTPNLREGAQSGVDVTTGAQVPVPGRVIYNPDPQQPQKVETGYSGATIQSQQAAQRQGAINQQLAGTIGLPPEQQQAQMNQASPLPSSTGLNPVSALAILGGGAALAAKGAESGSTGASAAAGIAGLAGAYFAKVYTEAHQNVKTGYANYQVSKAGITEIINNLNKGVYASPQDAITQFNQEEAQLNLAYAEIHNENKNIQQYVSGGADEEARVLHYINIILPMQRQALTNAVLKPNPSNTQSQDLTDLEQLGAAGG